MWNHTQEYHPVIGCIICIKSVIYNEMCRDAQGYTGRGTMSLYFRPLRNPFGTMQPAAQAAGCFCCPANGELAPRTTDNENRQEVRRTGGCMIPKGCPDPRGRPRDAASAAPRNLVLSAIILAKTPSEHTQRGFFLFLGSQKMHPKCTKV